MPLHGQGRFVRFLENVLSAAVLRTEVWEGGTALEEEMRRRVPRETGELEDAIQKVRGKQTRTLVTMGVGVPASHPAIHKAWATEFGTWNYTVGRPEAPKTNWPAKSKAGATMPWARTSVLVLKTSLIRNWRRRIARRLKNR